MNGLRPALSPRAGGRRDDHEQFEDTCCLFSTWSAHALVAEVSSLLPVLAPRSRWEWRVLKTMPMPVNVDAGMPCWATVLRNSASTIGPVTRWCAVIERA